MQAVVSAMCKNQPLWPRKVFEAIKKQEILTQGGGQGFHNIFKVA
jgi:hypothetical protein